MPPIAKSIISWAIVAWICKVFLTSLPYKFTLHPDTRHIFGTIGNWISGLFGEAIGLAFSKFGSYVVGSFELLTSLILLFPIVIWIIRRMGGVSSQGIRARFHAIGGLMASAVMAGAVFFHLFTPLGIEVLHEGHSDGGALFYSALSILLLGLVLFAINRSTVAKRNNE